MTTENPKKNKFPEYPKKGEPIFWDSASVGKFEHVWNLGENPTFEGYVTNPITITASDTITTHTGSFETTAESLKGLKYQSSYADHIAKYVTPPSHGGFTQVTPMEPPKKFVATQVEAVQWNGSNLGEVAALMGYGVHKGPNDELTVSFNQNHAVVKGNLSITNMETVYHGPVHMTVMGFGGKTADFNVGDWVIRGPKGATVMDKETFGLLFSESTPLEEM